MTTELVITPTEQQQQQQWQQQQQQQPPKHDKDELELNQQQIVSQSILADQNIKFPLENSWSFWFYKNEKLKSWKENVKFITTVDYVEDFWGVYNHLQLVSKMTIGCDYMFFKVSLLYYLYIFLINLLLF